VASGRLPCLLGIRFRLRLKLGLFAMFALDSRRGFNA
jgi:hypothetical protein